MKLKLFWKDENNNKFCIAILSKEINEYILEIQEKELKKAIQNGCIGIGGINFLKCKYTSKELFPFFKSRIPNENHPNIEKILKKLGLEKYDDMELLKITKGELQTDKYIVEE